MLVYRPPEVVFDFLFEFTAYPRYSEYLEDVRVDGEPERGTRFSIAFSWWRLNYRARGRVTGVDRPERIEFTITRDVDARGFWSITPVEVPERAPEGVETATRARLVVRFDADSADKRALDLPRFVPLDRVFARLEPFVHREGRKVARRAVADLEGASRPVELRIDSRWRE